MNSYAPDCIQITMHQGDSNSFLISQTTRVDVIVLAKLFDPPMMSSASYSPGLWIIRSLIKDGKWDLEFERVKTHEPAPEPLVPSIGLLEGGDREKLPMLVYTEDYYEGEGNYTLRIRDRGYAEMSSDEDPDVTPEKLMKLIGEYTQEVTVMLSVYKELMLSVYEK